MDMGAATAEKYPTRDCGRQIDEGDFYQVLQEREGDETLTDSTETLLTAARTYIAQEPAHVWKNAEMSVLGPDDQLVFVTGTQINRFVVTLDEKDKVRIYCKERSWYSRRQGASKPERSGFNWKSLMEKIPGYRKQTPVQDEMEQKESSIQLSRYNSEDHGKPSYGLSNGKYYSMESINGDGLENYYSADEYETTTKQKTGSNVAPKVSTWAGRISTWRSSVAKNSVVSSSICVVIGFFHMARLMLVAYWKIIRLVIKTVRS